MEAKDKAKELILKFKTVIVEELEGGEKLFDYTAKNCALIFCQEIINALIPVVPKVQQIFFWQEVKSEIEKL